MVKSPCFATFMLSKGKSQINPREFMILNKFRPVTLLNRAKAVGLQLLAFCLFPVIKQPVKMPIKLISGWRMWLMGWTP